MRILFLILFLFSSVTFTQAAYVNRLESTHNAILNLDFDEAKLLLSREPIDAASTWLISYASFIEYLTSSDPIFPKKQIAYYDEQVNALSQFDETAFQLLGIADSYLFKAYTHATIHEYLWAGTSYLKAQRIMAKLQDRYPDFYSSSRNKLIGIMADAWMSENLPFVNRIEDIESASKRYLKIQNDAVNDLSLPPAFKREIKIVGTLLFSYIEQSADKVFENANRYGKSWGVKGPIEELVYVNFSIKSDQHYLAQQCLKEGLTRGFNEKMNQLNLFLGNAYLNQLNDSSKIYITDFIARQNNPRALSYAKLKLAWYYVINNKNGLAQNVVQEILLVDELSTVEDAQAVYEAQNYLNWDKDLISARLLFDGGHYKRCIALLEKTTLSKNFNAEQKLEYHYRLSRAYHKLAFFDKAIVNYKLAIAIGLPDQYYYSAYASYYLAQIYRDNNNYDLAKEYYSLCSQTASPIYEASIHRKSKIERSTMK